MGPEPLLVSVIIPVFNGERFLAGAVASVLAQTHGRLEVLIVDDGSTDGSAAVARSFGARVRYHAQANRGPAAARNQGIRLATGSLLAFLDADDLWSETKLALQVPRLAENPAADVVLGRAQYLRPVDDAGATTGFAPWGEPRTALNLNCALARRQVFDRVGLLDESLFQCDDWDWFMRARELGVTLALHPEVVLRQRVHGGNITRDRERGNRFTLAMIQKSLQRRRQESGGPARALTRLAGQGSEPASVTSAAPVPKRPPRQEAD